MKKQQIQKDSPVINKPENGRAVKNNLPVDNTATNDVENAATQTLGLNQEKTTRDDLFPSDADNMTK